MKKKPLVLLTLALLPSFFTPANADLKDGLVAHWSFDDCTAKDNSGNGHDGTINGNPQCIDGVNGKAFSFDGVNFIDLGDMNYLLTNSLTFSLWVKKEQNGRVEGFLGKWNTSPLTDNSFLIYNGESSNVDYPTIAFNFDSSGNTGWTAKNKIISNVFTHLVFTWSNETGLLSIYQNGKLDVTYTNVGKGEQILNNPQSYTAKIGNWGKIHGTTHEFIGVTDDLRIYNRALSESEITELYKNSTETFKPSYTLSQPLDSIFNATDGSEQMDGTVFGQCVYGGYCARPTQKGALNGVNYMVDSGTPVYAICDGVVKNVTKGGDIKTRYTAIDHSNCGDVKGGLFAYYRHIDPAQNIKKGARIKAGDLIGTVATWKNNSHLQLSLATKFLSNLTGYTELKTITKADCSKTAVEQRRKTLNDTGWLDPIEIGMKSGWNSVLLKGGIAKTGCNATEQLYETAPLGNTLPYSPWK